MAFKTTKTLIFRGMCIFALGLGISVTLLKTAPAQSNRQAPAAERLDMQPGAKGHTPLEAYIIDQGFVDVLTMDPTLVVDLKYAKPDNFMGAIVYTDFTCAYLRPEASQKLAEANRILRLQYPHLRILVADALRPRRVQKRMWELVAKTAKRPYVANPSSGSIHNFGAAVDVTLYDITTQNQLDMGTPLDYFGPLAQPALEANYLKSGKLNESHLKNRAILRNAMCDAGWYPLPIEWWHFEAFPRKHIRKVYKIIE